MTTPRDIINLALKDVGATGEGIVPSAEDMNDSFLKLNWMVAQWQRKRWLVYHLVDLAVTSTGAVSYTIGPGGNIVVLVRPDSIESAFIRQTTQSQPSQVDYPLTIIPSRESYSIIALKQLASFPQYLYYDAAYPTGILYPWPVPQASIYELHIQVKEQLNQFTSIQQNIVLPEEYLPALEYNLAVRLFPQYNLPSRPDIVALAKDSLNVLRNANTQLSTLRMPNELVRNGIYNPYSDQIR